MEKIFDLSQPLKLGGHLPLIKQVGKERLKRLLIEMIDSIPPEQASLCRMYYGVGGHAPKNIYELAEIFGRPSHKIRLYLRRARREMQFTDIHQQLSKKVAERRKNKLS